MNYKDFFPKIDYNGHTIADITHRFKLLNNVGDYSTTLYNINIDAHDTPERVSLKAYGTTKYWWLILAVNEIVDPLYDWLMTDEEVIRYCESLYDDINSIHHYEDEDFVYYNENNPEGTLLPVTNMEWHLHLNDKKRRVNIIQKKYLNQVVAELNVVRKAIIPQAQEVS